jgi:pimeloyl-ACP methyl ester carboxylesterase
MYNSQVVLCGAATTSIQTLSDVLQAIVFYKREMRGELVLYQHEPALPLFINDGPSTDTALLCIAGMGDGLLSLPYLDNLLAAAPDARIVQVLLSSSYSGWGLASLDDDAAEIMQAIEHLVKNHGFKSVVLLGHSTGCQDTIHTLLTQTAHPYYQYIQAGILQAPVSDCEAFAEVCDKDALAFTIDHAQKLHPEDLLPRQMMRNVGFGNVAMTARRWLSVARPGGQDDYFSSAIPADQIRATFGAIKVPFMAIVGGDDEYVPASVDKEALVTLWRSNTQAPYFEKSFVLAGANHKVEDEGAQQALAWSICCFLKQL